MLDEREIWVIYLTFLSLTVWVCLVWVAPFWFISEIYTLTSTPPPTTLYEPCVVGGGDCYPEIFLCV